MQAVLAMHAAAASTSTSRTPRHSAVEIAPCSHGSLPGIGRTRNSSALLLPAQARVATTLCCSKSVVSWS